MILAAILITFFYCLLITSLIIGFDLVPTFNSKETTNDTYFSIIIPFRNEATQLPKLLKNIGALNYPLKNYELIFVDDDSEDDSVKIIEKFFTSAQNNIKIITNDRKTNSPKKDAINIAIQNATFNWIITTDADCLVAENWLSTFDAFIKKNEPKLIVAPVTYSSKNNFLERFQHLDFLSLMGSTIGGFGIRKPFLCNGANLCYDKQIFLEVGGFEGNTNIASGDDIFLLEKIVNKHPTDVHYLKSKEAIVTTQPQPTFKQLLDQRTRWAAKSTAYNNNFSKVVSLAVLSMNVLVIVLFLGSVFNINSWQLLLLIFSIKFCLDLILLFKTSVFFEQQKILTYYIWSSLLYPLFVMFVIISSLKSGYSWKGRVFKK